MLEVTQVPHQVRWQVKLSGRVVGHIKVVEGGSYQYFPQGCKAGGDKFPSLKAVIASLRDEE